MKKIITFVIVAIINLLFNLNCFAQSPNAIPYQGVARNASGAILSLQPLGLRFTIHHATAAGIVVYSETHTTSTNALGLFNLNIGTGTPSVGTMAAVDWANGAKFLQVEMDASSSGSYVDMGTTQMLSVPFALYAKIAGPTPGAVVYKGTWDAVTNTPHLTSSVGTKGDMYIVSNASPNPTLNTNLNGVTEYNVGDCVVFSENIYQALRTSSAPLRADGVTFAPNGDIVSTNVQNAIVEVRDDSDVKLSSKLNLSGGTMTGNLVLNADPTAAKGAVTKQYADAIQTAVTTAVNAKVNRSGDTMTGNLVLNADPSAALGAATKQYVDSGDSALQSQVNAKVNRSGDTMTGNLVLNADPSAALGAATKQYVDSGDSALQSQVNAKVNRSGDTMTGNLVLNTDPSAALGAATKQYVDSGDTTLTTQVSAKVSKAGDTMTGALILNADPTVALGASTKQYVDASLAPVQSQFASLIDSYIHRTEDGVYIYHPPGETFKRFGIGDTAPTAPLGILAEGSTKRTLAMRPGILTVGNTYTFSLTAAGHNGLNIESESSTGSSSRLFIQDSDGFVGIGSVTPEQKLHVSGANDGGSVGVQIQNTEVVKNRAWLESHFEDGDIPTQDGRFAISELPNSTTGSSPPIERMTILSGGNVGINEKLPFATLHVTRPLSDPNSNLSLQPNTGIAVIGPIDDNLVMDYRGIQARHGEFVASGSSLSSSELNLQRLGGDIVIHGDSTFDESIKTIITNEGKIGLGTLTPAEKLVVNGAITVGDTNTASPSNGTIRFTGGDFEGRKGGNWVSLTGSLWEKVDNSIYYLAGTESRVGIGTNTPNSTLDVVNNESVTSSSSSATISNTATTSSSSSSDNRVGLHISNSGSWGSNADAKNIGLYVSNVSGQSNSESNIAAVLNGNVIVGDVNASKVVGTNGVNVLAIQSGVAPTAAPGSTPTSGIQIYSAALPPSPGSPPSSVLHVMNGDGTVIQLYKQDALSPPDTTTPNSGDAATNALIENMRQRIDQLEAVLQKLGLIVD